ncbi:MAG TPA: aminoacetone oxidase family FAD-binding enzyme [Gemmatimonas sp.]|uniref:NAD(P)/FAD-dependent oxidoreductase n=1 Tax=Gemmatimonas sp. TaxID=1962908 RepID=UPI002ED85F71
MSSSRAGAMRRVVVIGAGAAGTMAAIFAAAGGAETILLERTRDGGRKILISGGGRCNVLPARLDESRFVTDSSPNTLRKIVRAWPLAEQIAFFEQEVGIALEEEVESVKLFPASHKARDVRDGLLDLAARRGVQLRTETMVTDIVREGDGWSVHVADDIPLHADAVIVATGGLSVPNTGSDGTGLRLLTKLGHVVHPTYAALTPVTSDAANYAELSGISLEVTLSARDETRSASATGGFLFTHRGYSGPSVLNVSHVVVRSRLEGGDPRAGVRVKWTAHDEAAWETLLKPQGTRQVSTAVRGEMPERLTAVLLAQARVEPTRLLAELTREERRRLLDTLVRGELPWNGDEGYKKAEVTGGGVRLSEIDPRTMESRINTGLYLCGEVLDAFGPIGGYNFLWAWATGRAAGMGAARPPET